MGKGDDTIKIYLRLKPHKNPSKRYHIEKTFDYDVVHFHVEKNAAAGPINNSKEDYSFKFGRVFDTTASQEEIFDGIARQAVQSALEGYNATIFAYGQTGSGKTYTITGGTTSFADRGIIPRAIAMIYQELNKQTEYEWSTRVSYLQIYNEKGSDLLNRGQDANNLDDLPKVTITEDADEVVLRGLEMHVSNSVEDALNLLFLGDTNRMYCETPMNPTSSRSHCIFTLGIECKAPGSSVVRRSKLHLVDLAGSERVGKTGVEGKLLSEAAYINLSLHYLEQVITALAEKAEGKRDHIPYRNSFMTQVLRDSLGGNCKTVMIATAHSIDAVMDESISTCRFAQRVASIKQDAKINEETDPKLLIRKLKQEIVELKEELAFYKKGDQDEDRVLSIDEVERCKAIVKEYLDNRDPDARLVGLQGDMSRIFFCYRLLKEIITEKPGKGAAALTGGSAAEAAVAAGADGGVVEGLQQQLRTLQLNLQQKDNELRLMLNIINQGKAADPTALAALSSASATSGAAGSGAGPAPIALNTTTGSAAALAPPNVASLTTDELGGTEALGAAYNLAALSDPNLLKDRTAAYEAFRKSYRKYENIERSKAELKEQYGQAKRLGAEVNALSGRIAQLKGRVQQLRAERAATGQAEPDAEETQLFQTLGSVKEEFRAKAEELKGLRSTIEHYHLMLEQAQKQLTRDFNQWYAIMERQQQQRRADRPAAHPTAAATAALPTVQLGFGGPGAPPAGPRSPAASVPAAGPGSGDDELKRLLQARDAMRKR
eukprot:EG_transcript_3847